MQKTRTRPYDVRLYYRAIGGETAPRRVIQLPSVFAAEVGESLIQASLGDGTGIVQIFRAAETGQTRRGVTVATDRVRSKKNAGIVARYTLIDPSIYMRHEQYWAYEDNGVLWIVPVSVHDAWVTALPGGGA